MFRHLTTFFKDTTSQDGNLYVLLDCLHVYYSLVVKVSVM